jgi:glutamyl-tRNA synthetase
LAEGQAYRCYCTAAELGERRQTARSEGLASGYDGRCRTLSAAEKNAFRDAGRVPSIRFLVEDEDIAFEDVVKGTVSFRGSDFGDFVISRPDGLPTYNFAVVVDDSHMRISHVIRAVGHLANTPKQILLYRALGEKTPSFAHIPTVLGPDGGKLSKREGARPVEEYRRDGYSADGVLNYLSLLSWSSPSGHEILSRERLIAEMDLSRTGVADPTLDPEKLRWMSGQHLRALPPQTLADRMAELTGALRLNLSREDLTRAAEMLADRITTLREAEAELEDLFREPCARDEPLSVDGETSADVCRRTAQAWAEQGNWSPVPLKADIMSVGHELAVKGKGLFQPLRLALIGQANGPDVADLAYVLGRERCLERLQSAS